LSLSLNENTILTVMAVCVPWLPLATIHAPSKGKVNASAKRHASRVAKSSGVVGYEDWVGCQSLCAAAAPAPKSPGLAIPDH
jgi:hypothetical protein